MKKTLQISICTHKRPNQLRQALRAVGKLALPGDLNVSLLVVDNAPSPAVKAVFEEETKELDIKVSYVEEHRQGLVHARNKVLEVAREESMDFIAFFDDDDRPDEKWLITLWECFNRFNATVVFGRMVYNWPGSCDLSEEMRQLYDTPLKPADTGQVRRRCGIGNTLIDFDFVSRNNLEFNPIFNRLGGEDGCFFETLTLKGGKIVRCNEAIIYSDVVEERANEDYILKRKSNLKYLSYVINRTIYGSAKANLKAVGTILVILIEMLLGLFSNSEKAKVLRKKRRAELNGLIAAIKGREINFYEQTDGN